MSFSSSRKHIARCVCGNVELETIGAPIVCAACHCDDCQEGSGRIERLPNAPSILDQAGGTAYLLYRKDRMKCTKGADQLRDYRLNEGSPTRRVVATCCNSFMFLDFQKGHWFSICRARFEGNAPTLQMHIQTKANPAGSNIPNDAPSYSSYPPRFIGRLMVARVAMLLHR